MANQYKNIVTASELLEVLAKQWCTTSDLILISGKGQTTTSRDRKAIVDICESKGMKYAKGLLPMEAVVDYYKINISYLKKVANINNK